MSFFGSQGQFDFGAWASAGNVEKTPEAIAPPAGAPPTSSSDPPPPPPPPFRPSPVPATPPLSANILQAGGPRKRIVKEGDWDCLVCGNVNFAKRTRCNKCSTPKPKTGDPLADVPHYGGPPGLFKKGDWPCAHCGNVNWARRDKCNICNAPKPTGGEEPRLGRGGGHFDLQDPADRNQHDSDEEEYDEFGRKKKGLRIRHKIAPSALRQSRLETPQHAQDSIFAQLEMKLAFPPAPSLRYLFRRQRPSEEEESSDAEDAASVRSRSRSHCGRPRDRRERHSYEGSSLYEEEEGVNQKREDVEEGSRRTRQNEEGNHHTSVVSYPSHPIRNCLSEEDTAAMNEVTAGGS